jgi:hypothetical protein
MQSLQLAPFRFDVTPPIGHSCCGGWIEPVIDVVDPLESIGFVLLGAGAPIVLCAIDWLAIAGSAYQAWCETLADAAGTSPDRVAVHCVHQHNAPIVCLETQKIIDTEGDLPHTVQVDFFEDCRRRAGIAVSQALAGARPVTHVAHGQAKVTGVASNRRVVRDENRVVTERRSSYAPAHLQALPEGLIDPWLKTVAFYDQDVKITACHYYATHPQSYYGDGIVNSDFVGLARKQRQAEEPDCLHMYFTGCAGDVAAGKYNDGSTAMRPVLAQRVYDGIVVADQQLRPVPIESVEWRTFEMGPPPPNHDLYDELCTPALLQAIISDRENSVMIRNRTAFTLAWVNRHLAGSPLLLSSLHCNDIKLLRLPGECFVTYQLRAQAMCPDAFIATAAYSDGGPWYRPTKDEYGTGGYELETTWCGSEIDDMLTAAMRDLLLG